MVLGTLIFQDKHTPINQTNKTREHATHTLHDTHHGRKAPAPHSAAPVLPHDAIQLWDLRMQLVRGRVWDTASTYQLNWEQMRYSAKKIHPGKLLFQTSRGRTNYCRDALHMVWWSTLVKSIVKQGLVHTSNNILSLAHHHCALARAEADDTYLCWGVIWAKEDEFVAASCFLWSAPHDLASVASCFWERFRDRRWVLRYCQATLPTAEHVKSQQISSLELPPELPLSSSLHPF